MKIVNTVRQVANEVRTVVGKHYPDFVYGGALSAEKQEVPVFVFHTIHPQLFESQLCYLKENGYRTIVAEEYYQWITNNKPIPEKSVLLAIDDGVESVWQYAYPLLEKYGFQAVVFVIPGYIRHRPEYFCNLKDQWDGKCDSSQIVNRAAGYYNLMYWEELLEAEQSGVLDIQSHTLFHHQVFQNNKLTGFFVPDDRTSFYDWVLPDGLESHINQDKISDYYGLPLYQADALFKTNQQYFDSEELRNRVVERFNELGGIEFYRQDKHGYKILAKDHDNLSRKYSGGSYLSGQDANNKIMENLLKSKNLIEEKLNKTVSHLCYPYSLYSENAISLSRQAGFKTNFIGTYPSRRTNYVNDDPLYTVRVKSDFLGTLPGNQRNSIYSVLFNKLKYRLRGEYYQY